MATKLNTLNGVSVGKIFKLDYPEEILHDKIVQVTAITSEDDEYPYEVKSVIDVAKKKRGARICFAKKEHLKKTFS